MGDDDAEVSGRKKKRATIRLGRAETETRLDKPKTRTGSFRLGSEGGRKSAGFRTPIGGRTRAAHMSGPVIDTPLQPRPEMR